MSYTAFRYFVVSPSPLTVCWETPLVWNKDERQHDGDWDPVSHCVVPVKLGVQVAQSLQVCRFLRVETFGDQLRRGHGRLQVTEQLLRNTACATKTANGDRSTFTFKKLDNDVNSTDFFFFSVPKTGATRSGSLSCSLYDVENEPKLSRAQGRNKEEGKKWSEEVKLLFLLFFSNQIRCRIDKSIAWFVL